VYVEDLRGSVCEVLRKETHLSSLGTFSERVVSLGVEEGVYEWACGAGG
jgi:hypothetical protein